MRRASNQPVDAGEASGPTSRLSRRARGDGGSGGPGAGRGAGGTLRFPAGFLWGTTSAAHQVEGAVAADGRGPSMCGLIVWSFQDNFASSAGYSKRFGLVWTDFATQQCTPKQSAYWYGDVIARNGLA